MWRTIEASFPRVTVLIFLEVVFYGMYSVNYLEQSNYTCFLNVPGIDSRNI